MVRPPGTDPQRPFTLAVNVDLAESALAHGSRGARGPGHGAGSGPAAGPAFDAATLRREDRERRQSLWRYLLLAALALLLVETAVSNWVSKREWVSRQGGGTVGAVGREDGRNHEDRKGAPRDPRAVRRVRRRWRLRIALRGLAVAGALSLCVVLFLSSLALERLRFAPEAVLWLRVATWGTLVLSVGFFLVRPLLRRVDRATSPSTWRSTSPPWTTPW